MNAAEAGLWRAWKTRRDRDAFRRLVDAHQAFVHDFARRVCGHDADAEDIAQEAFLELAEAPIERPLEVGFRAFLGRRIVLAARTLRRAALTRRAKEAAVPPPTHARATHAEVEDTIALLGTEEREAVVLRFLHGLSYAEVAEVLGVSEGAARVRVHRALHRLRTRLGPRAERAIAALPLFLPAETFSHAATAAAVVQGGVALAATSAKRYLLVVLVLLLAVGGVVATRAMPSRTVARAPPGTASDPATLRSAAVDALADKRVPGDPDGPADISDSSAFGATTSTPGRDAGDSGSGRLRFADGSPVRAMPVRVEFALEDSTTDDEGRFELPAETRMLPRKLYHVGPDDYVVSLGSLAADQGDVVIERGLDLRGSVVLERTGGPVAGAVLEMTRPGAVASGTSQAAWGKAKSDAEGRFAFEHVLPASYDILVTAPGIEPLKTSLDAIEGAPPSQIVVRPARAMSVRFAYLGKELVGAKVSLGVWGKEGTSLQVWYWDLEIDANHAVHAEAPPPGRYGIRIFGARGEGGPPVRIKDAEFDSHDGEPVVINLEPDSGGGRVEGSLLVADGSPLSGAYVRLDGGQLQARTDSAGRFVIGDVPPGPQRLTVAIGSAELQVGRFDVPPQGDVSREFRLTGTGAVVGRFTSANVESVPAAHVYLRRKADGEVVARATFGIGGDGGFRFPYLDPGTYELVASVLRKGSTKRDVVVANETVDLGDLAIDPTPDVPVVATGPPGVRIAGEVPVRGTGPDGAAGGWLALGDDGRGFLRGLKPGRYRLIVTVPGCASLELDVEVEEKPTEPLVFTLARK